MRTRDEVLQSFGLDGLPDWLEAQAEVGRARDTDADNVRRLADRIRELEAQLAASGEPVAWALMGPRGPMTFAAVRSGLEFWEGNPEVSIIPLYAHPPASAGVHDREQMREVIALAHELGWNGVENSKILSVFLRNHIESLTPAPVVPVVADDMVEAACKVWDSPDSAWSFRRAMKQALTAALTAALRPETRGKS